MPQPQHTLLGTIHHYWVPYSLQPGGSPKKVRAFNFDGNARAHAFRSAPTFGNFDGNAQAANFPKVGTFWNARAGAFSLFQKSSCVPGNAPTCSYKEYTCRDVKIECVDQLKLL